MNILQQRVSEYIDLGFCPVPVKFLGKACLISEWQKLRLTCYDVPKFFDHNQLNIGIILGEASGGLVDVDLDCKNAIRLAPHILPPTEMKFGRASKPESHWLYRVSEPGASIRFSDPEYGMLVELRSTNAMTVFPGSVHESGEEVRFDADGNPVEIEFSLLEESVRDLGAACLVLPLWQKGQRHNLALALAGVFLAAGRDEVATHRFLEALVQASGDSEGEDRHQCVQSTNKRLQAGDAVSGKGDLADLISNDQRTSRILKWLDIGSKEIVIGRQDTSLVRAYGGPVPYSDAANAERFTGLHQRRALYSHETKKWLVWDGCRWGVDFDGAIDRMAVATARAIAIEASTIEDKDAFKWASRSHDLKHLKAMIALAQSRCTVRLDEFDSDPLQLNCASGVVDLCTGELMPHEPGRLMRKMAPVAYDPYAGCPTFLGFLDRVFAGDRGLIDFVQRAIGYSLTGLTREQCLFMVVGNGANGKSTLIRVIQDLLGDYAQQTPMDTLMVTKSGGISNDVARLQGARFVAAAEAEADHRLAEAKIKQLTGGDAIAARFLYGEFFEYVPQFKLWLATNRLPAIRGTDEGIWRRINVIPFDVTIPESDRDPALRDKLRGELPGILNWAIAGGLVWQNGGLRPPQRVTDATKGYRTEMDLVAQFIDDCCLLDQWSAETARALYDSYTGWSHENGEQSLTKRALGQRLGELGFKQARVGKIRKWRGLQLRSDTELLEVGLGLGRYANPNDLAQSDCSEEEMEMEGVEVEHV